MHLQVIPLANPGTAREYEELEYQTQDPYVVKFLEDFKEEHLECEITLQLKLESYVYHFLRVNKFTLLPKPDEQTRLYVLNSLMERVFAT